MYVVIKPFKDGKDNDRLYKVGDKYPRRGLRPTKKRIEQLSTSANPMGYAFIEEK